MYNEPQGMEPLLEHNHDAPVERTTKDSDKRVTLAVVECVAYEVKQECDMFCLFHVRKQSHDANMGSPAVFGQAGSLSGPPSCPVLAGGRLYFCWETRSSLLRLGGLPELHTHEQRMA